MTRAESGHTVRVQYTARLDDGTVVDAVHAEQPLEFRIGDDIAIPGFERALIGMCPGETKRVRIPPEDAYGAYREDRVVVLERAKLAGLIEPAVGMMIRVGANEATARNMTITALDDRSVTLDGNHRLAGKALSFEIHLLDTRPE